jgi:hypothetical protein
MELTTGHGSTIKIDENRTRNASQIDDHAHDHRHTPTDLVGVIFLITDDRIPMDTNPNYKPTFETA